MKYYIGIDLGGTTIQAGVVTEEFDIVATAPCTPNLPSPAAALCAALTLRLVL